MLEPKDYIADEVPAYLKQMQISLIADLMLEADKEILTIQQLVRRLKQSGMAGDEIKRMLFQDLTEGGQLFGDFRKNMKATVKKNIEDIGRNEIVNAFEGAELWEWLGIVDGSICPDCLRRHEEPPNTYEYWQRRGVPGSGATRCGLSCRCDLVPTGLIAKEPGGLKR